MGTEAQAKGVRYAHGIHASQYLESVLTRTAAEAKLGEADGLECDAWKTIMWAGGPAMPSPDDPQAEPRSARRSMAALISWRPSATVATASPRLLIGRWQWG
jgi:hypothetical protein